MTELRYGIIIIIEDIAPYASSSRPAMSLIDAPQLLISLVAYELNTIVAMLNGIIATLYKNVSKWTMRFIRLYLNKYLLSSG